MDGLPVMRGAASYWVLRAAAATVLLGAAASCSSGTAGGTASPASATASATPIPTGPVTAEISQFRDNYSKQIIEIQLTNTTGHALTVLGAELTSPLFAAPIIWSARTGGIELPPGQPKSLPAPLPAPDCGSPAARSRAGSHLRGCGRRPRIPAAGHAGRCRAGPGHGSGNRPVRRPGAEQFGAVPGPGSLGRRHDRAGSRSSRSPRTVGPPSCVCCCNRAPPAAPVNW